jgi:pimeloyl-ACP methyl ester carboxylesterase
VTQSRSRSMRLSDGRQLSYAEWGDPDGAPLLFFHGGNGSRLERHPDDEMARRAGVRLVTMDRPGHGGSDFARRSFVEGAADIDELADELGIERLALAGWSSGTPYVLACAHELPQRVTRALVSGTLAPIEGTDFMTDFMRGLPWHARAIIGLCRTAPWLAYPLFAGRQRRRSRDLEGFLEGSARRSAARNRDLLLRDDLRPMFLASFEECVRSGIAGAAWGSLLNARPWGFDLGGIRVAVEVWHGSEDRQTPLAFARSVTQAILGARLREFRGEGHLLLLEHWQDMLEWSLSGDSR